MKWINPDLQDLVLDGLAGATGCTVCTASLSTPPTYAQASDSCALTDVITLSPSDFTTSDGAVSGRKLTIGEKVDQTVSASGTATHVCLLDTANSKVLYVVPITAQPLVSGNTVTIPTWNIELRDPA